MFACNGDIIRTFLEHIILAECPHRQIVKVFAVSWSERCEADYWIKCFCVSVFDLTLFLFLLLLVLQSRRFCFTCILFVK